MNGKLLNRKKYPPKCAYCARGRLSPNGKDILCNKNGINYDEFMKTKEGKKLVQKCITENKKEYRNLRKKLQEKV